MARQCLARIQAAASTDQPRSFRYLAAVRVQSKRWSVCALMTSIVLISFSSDDAGVVAPRSAVNPAHRARVVQADDDCLPKHLITACWSAAE